MGRWLGRFASSAFPSVNLVTSTCMLQAGGNGEDEKEEEEEEEEEEEVPNPFKHIAAVVLHGRDGEKVPKGGPILPIVQQTTTVAPAGRQGGPHFLHFVPVGVRALEEAAGGIGMGGVGGVGVR